MRRGIASVVLILSTAVAAILPMADARADIASAAARPHVEQPGSRHCPQVHDELTCQLCRVMRLASNRSSSDGVLIVHRAKAVVLARHVAPFVARPVEPSSSPRAPPLG